MPISSRSTLRRLTVAVALVLSAAISSCDSPARSATGPEQPREATIQDTDLRVVNGTVVGIADGDTITVLTPDLEEVKVRLANVDAPERGQPWGNRSKQVLSSLVSGREVRVRQTDVDRWGRIVGHVSVETQDVNREMVAQGAAWAFRRYLSDPSLIEVEAFAKRDRLGLWAMPEAETVPPWEWRQGVRGASAPDPALVRQQALPSAGVSGAVALSCGSKTRCSQMASCAEAEFYLRQCRLTTIDGNRDGEPCEQLCGTASR